MNKQLVGRNLCNALSVGKCFFQRFTHILYTNSLGASLNLYKFLLTIMPKSSPYVCFPTDEIVRTMRSAETEVLSLLVNAIIITLANPNVRC